MKDFLRKTLEWLVGGAVAIAGGAVALIVYGVAMFFMDFSLGVTIALPIVVVIMFGSFMGTMWLSERIHYLWLFALWALLLAGAAWVASLLDAGDDVLFLAGGVLIITGALALSLAVSAQREKKQKESAPGTQ